MARDVEPAPFRSRDRRVTGSAPRSASRGPWQASDYEAMLLTIRAHQVVRAKRPTCEQGQPEYTQPGVMAAHRETCAHCGKPLPEGHYKFCGSLCLKAHRRIIADRLDC
jgi:hypothetical protein